MHHPPPPRSGGIWIAWLRTVTVLTSKPENDAPFVFWYTRAYLPSSFKIIDVPPGGCDDCTTAPPAEAGAAPTAEVAPGAPAPQQATSAAAAGTKAKRVTVQDLSSELRALKEKVTALEAVTAASAAVQVQMQAQLEIMSAKLLERERGGSNE